jgi:hypothetical protein
VASRAEPLLLTMGPEALIEENWPRLPRTSSFRPRNYGLTKEVALGAPCSSMNDAELAMRGYWHKNFPGTET